MTLRIALGLAGLAALALPLPAPTVLGGGLVVIGLVALALAVLRPGSGAPAALLAAVALSWLSTPAGHVHDLRLGALALALAVVHSSAALAAVVPVRARIPAALALRWLGWTAVSTGLGIAAIVGASALSVALPPVPVTIAAVLAVGLLAALATRAAR